MTKGGLLPIKTQSGTRVDASRLISIHVEIIKPRLVSFLPFPDTRLIISSRKSEDSYNTQ